MGTHDALRVVGCQCGVERVLPYHGEEEDLGEVVLCLDMNRFQNMPNGWELENGLCLGLECLDWELEMSLETR